MAESVSESNTEIKRGIVVNGEDTESDSDEGQVQTNSLNDDIVEIRNVAADVVEVILKTDVQLTQHSREQPKDATKLSLLHRKLQEANIKLLNSVNSVPQNICRDIGSTMKRVGERLDKTQATAIETSNNIRKSITNLKSCAHSISTVEKDNKKYLPLFKSMDKNPT